MSGHGRLYAFDQVDRKLPVERIRPAPTAALWRRISAGAIGHERSFVRATARTF